jgi:hypothetical protein
MEEGLKEVELTQLGGRNEYHSIAEEGSSRSYEAGEGIEDPNSMGFGQKVAIKSRRHTRFCSFIWCFIRV